MKKLILVRHCSATGQEQAALLTPDGEEQAISLAHFLMEKNLNVRNIISSPFVRTMKSITPFASQTNLPILADERLTERVLSGEPMDDWLQKLEETFLNIDLTFIGGESTREAMNRVSPLIQNVIKSEENVTLLVTHGNLLTIILKLFDKNIGFSTWKSMSNPDVYEITIIENETKVTRLWNDEQTMM